MANEPLNILLIEDHDADVILAEAAFEELAVPHRLHIVRTADEALEFLSAEGRHANAPRPDLILLDLSLPRMTGLEVLLHLRDHVQWRAIPVIVLTLSTADHDVWESYHRGANAYMIKPTSVTQFVENLRALTTFWQVLTTRPSDDEPR